LLTRLTEPDVSAQASATVERRAHRRSRSEQIRIVFLGADHIPLNWSEGGALLEDRHPDIEVGTVLPGVLIIGTNSLRFRFSAEVIRRDPQVKQIAIQFVAPSPLASRGPLLGEQLKHAANRRAGIFVLTVLRPRGHKLRKNSFGKRCTNREKDSGATRTAALHP